MSTYGSGLRLNENECGLIWIEIHTARKGKLLSTVKKNREWNKTVKFKHHENLECNLFLNVKSSRSMAIMASAKYTQIIEVSLSEPHTSESNGGIFIYTCSRQSDTYLWGSGLLIH